MSMYKFQCNNPRSNSKRIKAENKKEVLLNGNKTDRIRMGKSRLEQA